MAANEKPPAKPVDVYYTKKRPSVSQTVNSFCNAVRYSMVLGESRHFLMSAPFLPDLSTPGSALSPAFKRGIKERDAGKRLP